MIPKAHTIFNVCITICVVGGAFLVWYYWIDGVYLNRVLDFKNGVDPMHLELVNTKYKPGMTPQFFMAYCKTRDAVATTRWTLVNEHPHYDDGKQTIAEIPVGCYPLDGGKQVGNTKPIPGETPPGEYHYVGVTNHVLPDGRVRKQYLETEEFTVTP